MKKLSYITETREESEETDTVFSVPRPFKITVQPQTRLHPCAALRAEQSRGLYGFHRANCPDCVRVHEGFALWGENGYLQGVINQETRPTDEELSAWAARCRFSTPTIFTHRESGHTYMA